MNQNLTWLKKLLAHPLFAPLWPWVDSLKVSSYFSILGMLLIVIPLSRIYESPYADFYLGVFVIIEVLATRLNPYSSLNMWLAYRHLTNAFLLTAASLVFVSLQINVIILVVYGVATFICFRRALMCGRVFLGEKGAQKMQTRLSEHLDAAILK